MNVCFTQAEPDSEQFFESRLVDHEIGSYDELTQIPADADCLSIFIGSRITAEFLDGHPNLRFIATRSTGVDHIDLAACHKRGVTVSFVPSYGENTVAEHTFALL